MEGSMLLGWIKLEIKRKISNRDNMSQFGIIMSLLTNECEPFGNREINLFKIK